MTNINIRVDDQLKKEAQTLYKNLGMDLSTAINVFLRQSVQDQALPFQPKFDPFWSEPNQRYLKKAIAEMEAGKNTIIKTMEDLEALRKDEP